MSARATRIYLERTDIGLWAVSDGMGGHSAGDVASALIVDSMRDLTRPNGDMSFIKSVYDTAGRRQQRATSPQRGPRPPSDHGRDGRRCSGRMRRKFFCLWAGDSRLYRFQNGKLTQLTKDHRYIQDLIDSGTLDEEGAQHHPLRNVITRAVGIDPDLELDRTEGVISPGDIFLLVSDGVTAVCDDEDLRRVPVAPRSGIGGRRHRRVLSAWRRARQSDADFGSGAVENLSLPPSAQPYRLRIRCCPLTACGGTRMAGPSAPVQGRAVKPKPSASGLFPASHFHPGPALPPPPAPPRSIPRRAKDPAHAALRLVASSSPKL